MLCVTASLNGCLFHLDELGTTSTLLWLSVYLLIQYSKALKHAPRTTLMVADSSTFAGASSQLPRIIQRWSKCPGSNATFLNTLPRYAAYLDVCTSTTMRDHFSFKRIKASMSTFAKDIFSFEVSYKSGGKSYQAYGGFPSTVASSSGNKIFPSLTPRGIFLPPMAPQSVLSNGAWWTFCAGL